MLGVRPRQFAGYTITPALRLSAAVLISSIAVVPAYLLAILTIGGWPDDAALFPVLMVALMLTLAAVAVVGIPAHLLLATLHLRGAIPYVLAGCLVPVAFLFAAEPFGDALALALPAQAALAGGFGALVALVFWGVAVWSG